MKATANNKKFRLRKNDKVKVIAGANKGKTGTVLRVIKDKDRVLIEGVNIIKRHTKPSAKFPDGGIIEKESGIHISNVMLIDPSSNSTTKVGRRKDEKGKLVRYSKKSGKNL